MPSPEFEQVDDGSLEISKDQSNFQEDYTLNEIEGEYEEEEQEHSYESEEQEEFLMVDEAGDQTLFIGEDDSLMSGVQDCSNLVMEEGESLEFKD